MPPAAMVDDMDTTGESGADWLAEREAAADRYYATGGWDDVDPYARDAHRRGWEAGWLEARVALALQAVRP